MFSKIRKHLNIMLVLLISLTLLLGIVFVGVISIDQYCEDNVLESVESEEELIAERVTSLTKNIASTIESIEVTLRYEPDALVALQSCMGLDQSSVKERKYDNCVAVISNTYYNVGTHTETSEIEFRKFNWYQGACKQKDGSIYVSPPFVDKNDGKEYVAFSKFVKNGSYVVAICITTENLRKELNGTAGRYEYLVNASNEIVATGDGANIGINVSSEGSSLPKGHDEVFKSIASVTQRTIIDTQFGKMYTSKYSTESGLTYVVIREEGKIVNKVSSAYLEIIIAVIIMIPIIICMYVVAQRYSRRVTEIYSNKCEFIEGLALEMKIPLETIRLASNELMEYGLEDNIKKQVDTILESTKAIAFDLNSAYDYSKLGLRELMIENGEYSFGRILKNVEKVVHCDMQKNNIYFDPIIEGNEELKLYGDHRKIEEIIINTVKYCASQTIEGGIELKVMYADLTTDSVNVMLIIKDTGVGMSDTELPMFVEGLKTYTSEIEVEHSGIGLEMVKQLLKLLNGKINVDSTKNVGSIFTIMVPQKIVIGDDSKWENEDVRTSTELIQLYSRLDKEQVDYSYIAKVEEKVVSTNVGYTPKLDVVASPKEARAIAAREAREEKEAKAIAERQEKEAKAIAARQEKEAKAIAAREEKALKEKNNAVFGKKINRLEDMIPQPELINDVPDSMENNLIDNEIINEAQEYNQFKPSQGVDYQGNIHGTENNVYRQSMDKKEEKVEQRKNTRPSVTRYLDDDNNVNQEVEQKEEIDVLEQQMRQQMEAQANNLYQQMANNEISRVSQQAATNMINSVEEQDKRIELLKNTLGQEGIDVDSIVKEYNNDIDSYEKTLIEFYDYSKANANKIITLWNQKQFNEYFSAIDTIKAGAEAIGAIQLANVFESQLQKGGEGDLKYVAVTIKDAFGQWKKLLALIAQFEKDKNSL